MKFFLMGLICLFSLGSIDGISGHTAHPATTSGDTGISIHSINQIPPDSAHNFTIGSANSTITITSVANGIDLKVGPDVGTMGVSLYVVDSQGNAGYTTIQEAINAAVSAGASSANPQTVWIWPGTYLENLTLYPFVNLSAASDSTVSSAVIVVGNAIYPDPFTGSLSITNIEFTSSLNSPTISFQSNQASEVVLSGVYCNSENWTSFECIGSGMDILYSNGFMECLNTANMINMTAGKLKILSSRIEFNNSIFQSTISGSSTLEFFSSVVNDAYTVGTGSRVLVFNSVMGLTAVGFAPLTLDSGATCTVVNSVMGSNSFIISGSGTVNYSAVTSLTGANFDPNLTTVSLPQITVPVASSTATSGFGTTLTAGTPVLNNLGYEVLLNICASISSSTAATIKLGVGPTNPPTTNTVVSTFTVSTPTNFNFTAIVPRDYYVLVDTTGTITVDSIMTQACPL